MCIYRWSAGSKACHKPGGDVSAVWWGWEMLRSRHILGEDELGTNWERRYSCRKEKKAKQCEVLQVPGWQDGKNACNPPPTWLLKYSMGFLLGDLSKGPDLNLPLVFPV